MPVDAALGRWRCRPAVGMGLERDADEHEQQVDVVSSVGPTTASTLSTAIVGGRHARSNDEPPAQDTSDKVYGALIESCQSHSTDGRCGPRERPGEGAGLELVAAGFGLAGAPLPGVAAQVEDAVRADAAVIPADG
ncbi:hypothetical protein GCM10009665_39720 [Kitasatospora nipponensis]|uniref:Uncharacterized protein n=1 Tax=Kitasatospora nipponensis TaxID=258049 RepID=A0ABN1WBT8_9ACTN